MAKKDFVRLPVVSVSTDSWSWDNRSKIYELKDVSDYSFDKDEGQANFP